MSTTVVRLIVSGYGTQSFALKNRVRLTSSFATYALALAAANGTQFKEISVTDDEDSALNGNYFYSGVEGVLDKNHIGVLTADDIGDGTINKTYTATERVQLASNTTALATHTEQIADIQDNISGVAAGAVNILPGDTPTDGIDIGNVSEAGVYTNFDAVEVTEDDLLEGSVQLRKISGTWEKFIIPVALGGFYNKTIIDQKLLPTYLKDRTLSFTTDELTIISAITSLELSVLAAEKADDWRLTFVATEATSGSTFNYNVRVRNITKGENYDIVDDENLDISTLNVVKLYSGTKLQNSKTIGFAIGVDWNKLPIGETFQYFNNSGNLKVNPGFNSLIGPIDEKQRSIDARVTTNETALLPLASVPARAAIIEAALSEYVLQSLSLTGTGNYMNTSGVITPGSYKYLTFAATDYDKYKVSSVVSGAPVWLAIYKNSLGNVIGTAEQGTGGVDTVHTDKLLSQPLGTTSITINSKTSGTITVKKLTVQTPARAADVTANAAKIAEVRDPLLAFNVLTTTINATPGYTSQSGVFTANGSYKTTVFTVSDTDRIKITTVINGNPLRAAVFLSSTNTVLGTYQNGTNSVDTPVNDVELTLPAGTTSIAVNGKSTTTIVIKKYGVQPIPTFADLEVLQDQIDIATNQWTGKTWIWFGTSIPAGQVGLTPDYPSYPVQAANKLGATVINQAKASSMARSAYNDGSFAGMSWQNYVYALTHSIAQKQAIITNWVTTYQPVLGNTPPATLDADEQALILSCSYENKLLPYLDGTHEMPDLFVFDHGHNDNLSDDSDSEFTSVPATRNNVNYFLGAMNFLIDLILQYNPHARIAFIGHYENARKTRISEAQVVLAEYWDFPLLKTWEKMGWTQRIVPGTGLTLTQTWMPDDLHPSSDSTGAALDLYGNVVTHFLRGVF